jgi:cell pole-organizing protein PopZ
VRIEPDLDIAEPDTADDEADEAADIRADNDVGQTLPKADERSGQDDVAPEEEAFDSDIREAVTAAMAVEPQLEESPEPQAEAEAEPAETGRQLVSSATGAKVAAAFEDLSEAFKAEQRRSFDEMAEEMLRPMLQQWLDDNLPTLVERLVREEIERVARGGRR